MLRTILPATGSERSPAPIVALLPVELTAPMPVTSMTNPGPVE